MKIRIYSKTKICGAWYSHGDIVDVDDSNEQLIQRLFDTRATRVEEKEIKIHKIEHNISPVAAGPVDTIEQSVVRTPNVIDTPVTVENTIEVSPAISNTPNYTHDDYGDIVLIDPDKGVPYTKSQVARLSKAKLEQAIQAATANQQ